MRIYDVTNGQQIAIISSGSDPGTNYAIWSTTTLSNLPTGEAIWQIQGREGGTGWLHLASAHIFF